jgi:serine/threonine-protein kinase
VPYIVMERLDGLDLAALCKQKKRLSIQEAARYLLEACEAIAEAHELGIIHRDLKPGNIFLARKRDGSPTIKVLDFGISKLTGVLAQHQATTIGTVLGSPSYMSPEQMASAPDVDGRTDIWALGAILYQLTTGELPFKGDTLPQLCMKVLQAAPAKPTVIHGDFPPDFEALILRCLEKDRGARFGDVSALMAALRPFAGVATAPPVVAALIDDPTAPLPPSEPATAAVPTQMLNESIVSSAVTVLRPQAPTKSRRLSWLAGAGAIGVVLVGGIVIALGRDARSPRSAADASATTVAITTNAPPATSTAASPTESASTPLPAPVPDLASALPSASAVPSAPPVIVPPRATTPKPAKPLVTKPVKPAKNPFEP